MSSPPLAAAWQGLRYGHRAAASTKTRRARGICRALETLEFFDGHVAATIPLPNYVLCVPEGQTKGDVRGERGHDGRKTDAPH